MKDRYNCITNNSVIQDEIDVAAFIRFLKNFGLFELFEKLPDKRQKAKTIYSINTLALWSFFTCIFRLSSKNAFQTSYEHLTPKEQEGIKNILKIPKNIPIPYSSTVDDALDKIHYEEFNNILISLFKKLIKGKFFYNHPELFLSDSFMLGVDGYWTHKYDKPHAVDKMGNNACPYCLKRTHHAGTDKEEVYYVHVLVTFIIIFNGLTLPIYTYPLKATQINLSKNDDELKQECELIATHEVLQLLKKNFPRTAFTVLGDALYANRTTINLCNDLDFKYIFVYKEKKLKNIDSKCNELAKTKIYQDHYAYKQNQNVGNKYIEKEASWFNHVYLDDKTSVNVLRFKEVIYENGSIKDEYNGGWLCSRKIFKESCFKTAKIGRQRWCHEDFHNTCKHRGFNIKHDMARTRPNLLIAWKIMLFIAFAVFELFRFSTKAIEARKSRSLMKFAKDLFQQIINIPWEIISNCLILKKLKVQFRFCFNTA